MSRIYNSQAFITTIVIAASVLPVVGAAAAFWTGDWRYLVSLFALGLFF